MLSLVSTNKVENLGDTMAGWVQDLYPWHRSISGSGVRQSLEYLQSLLPLEVHEVPTGTAVLDWTVPQEWSIQDAYIADQYGQRIVDYRVSNLHVISYSQPFAGRMRWQELEPHLHVAPESCSGDAIPYRTAYFREQWGFCVSREQKERLTAIENEEFEVRIDAKHFVGALSYSQATWGGQSDETILLYAHCCHPSLANDNLSGIVVAAAVGQWLSNRVASGELLKKSYQIVFAPATIGAITWLARNQADWPKISAGLVLSLLGDDRPLTYKQSRSGSGVMDRVMAMLSQHDSELRTISFRPFGYDERQFNSPGVRLPVGCLMRSMPDEYEFYHTSDDRPEVCRPQKLAAAARFVQEALWAIEQNCIPINLRPFGEPQLGKYGLYRAFGELDDRGQLQDALLWVLNLGDGQHDLVSIALRSELPFPLIHKACVLLQEHSLIETASQPSYRD